MWKASHWYEHDIDLLNLKVWLLPIEFTFILFKMIPYWLPFHTRLSSYHAKNKSPLSHWMFCYTVISNVFIWEYKYAIWTHGQMFCKRLVSLCNKSISVYLNTSTSHDCVWTLTSAKSTFVITVKSMWFMGNSLFLPCFINVFIVLILASSIRTKLWPIYSIFSSRIRAYWCISKIQYYVYDLFFLIWAK